jgi:integrase
MMNEILKKAPRGGGGGGGGQEPQDSKEKSEQEKQAEKKPGTEKLDPGNSKDKPENPQENPTQPKGSAKKPPDSKTDNGHRIYLNTTAREIIGKRPKGGGPVFKSRKTKDGIKQITVRSLTKALRRAGHFGLASFTSHDLRRTAATHLGELGYDDFIIGVILTHKRRGVTKIYNRYRYDAQKREAMDRWDERLKEILEG